MNSLHSALAIVAVAGAAGVVACSTSAGAADVDVHVYRAPPAYAVPPPVLRPRVVIVESGCAARTVRVWVAGRYVYRTVRVCS